MNEINSNALGGSMGIGRSLDAVASQKSLSIKSQATAADSVEFSQIPDLSTVDKTVEDDFAELRSRLQESANSELYPPLKIIDKLSAMLAIDLNTDSSNL